MLLLIIITILLYISVVYRTVHYTKRLVTYKGHDTLMLSTEGKRYIFTESQGKFYDTQKEMIALTLKQMKKRDGQEKDSVQQKSGN